MASSNYYSCEKSNRDHTFESATIVWLNVTYKDVSICEECGSVYNFGFNIGSANKNDLKGIDLSVYKMQGPTECSQQALYARKRLAMLQWTPEQEASFGRLLDIIRRDIEEIKKNPHAYPIWRVQYDKVPI